MKRTLRNLTKTEKILITFLTLIVLFTGYRIGQAFYLEYSVVQPVDGGLYTEGAVGKITPLNPLLVHPGSISNDLTQLIFSGLTKYDPETGKIVGDIANYKISQNGKEYTFVIKEGIKWHDGEPLTADDVVFTYNNVIANPAFKGAILSYNDYAGTKVSKVDERTVQFILEKPDSFFLVKTLPGILPKHLLENDPIEFIETAPFNFAPVGTGRYRFIRQTNFEDHVEISLEAFQDYYDTPPHIQNILIKVFPDFKTLQKKLGELDGLRNVPSDQAEIILKKKHLVLQRYQLPQYVAVFMNTESPNLKNKKVRLALQLGTDKQSLVAEIGEHKTVDTPLLEIDPSKWFHQYSINKANGALFDTQWKIPGKENETEEDEEEPEEQEPDPTYINSPNEGRDWKTTQNKITITGTQPKNTKAVMINDYELKKYVPGDSGWSYVASVEFENLKPGENVFDVYAIDFNENKELIDSITITYGDPEGLSEIERDKLEEENAKAAPLPIRENSKGEKLTLNLITSSTPETYSKVAEIIKKQWQNIGVDVQVEILESSEFQKRMNNREYDLLIFGQNLGYNLDAYPYWHSSQAKTDGYNLSQFKNFVVDSLLEKARLENDGEARKETLNQIQEVISQEAPAVFLYSPTYYFALSDKIQNATFKNMATASDRFGSIQNWYGKVDRSFKKGTNPLVFLAWIIKQF